MQTGEYTKNRLMVESIREICERRGILFSSLSHDWLLELRQGSKVRHVLGYTFSLNDAVAAGIAKDKVATHQLLRSAGIPSVPHVLLRPKISEQQKQPLREWGDIVVKPLDGSGGHGVRRFRDADEAAAWIETTGVAAWAAAPWLDIVKETRFILLDQKQLITYEKQPVMVSGLAMFNLGLGATPKESEPNEDVLSIAVQAQKALGLRLSAVDIIETAHGAKQVLEINSGFMMEHYMQFSPTYRQQGFAAYEQIIDAVMHSQ